MITQTRLFTLLSLLLLTFCCRAQTWAELSTEEKQKTQQLWSKLTHTATLSLGDSTFTTGQVLFSTDSGIVWRSVPQYTPYHSDNIQLIPYRNIHWLQTNRQGRLGRHIVTGSIVGAVVGTGLSYLGTRVIGAFYPFEGQVFAISTTMISTGVGLVGGVIVDKIRSQRKIYTPDAKTIRRVGALYSPKKETSWRKHWIDNDSLIQGYSLPPTLDKIKPFYNASRFEFSGHINISSDFSYDFSLENASISRFGDGYDMSPHTLEFRLSYRMKPWLKVGLLTHKNITGSRYIELYHSGLDIDFFQYGSGNIQVNYERTFGLYTEYIPFPIKYSAFRRWEPFLGAGLLREKGDVSVNYGLDYRTPDLENYETGLNETSPFHHLAGMGFMGIRFYANRSLSFEAQLGRYFSPRLSFQPAAIDIIEPYSDIGFQLNDLQLSRTYVSMAASIRL